jgi:hypothetical protein
MADDARFALHNLVFDHAACFVVVGPFTARRRARIELSDKLSQSRLNEDEHSLPGTGDLLRYGAERSGYLESVVRALRRIGRVLPRFFTLSNCCHANLT